MSVAEGIATAAIPDAAVPDPALDQLKTVFSPETLTRKGLCPVTALKAQSGQGTPAESHSLYFEQHGRGPQKVLFIMGLNSTAFAWVPQVAHFGRLEDYTITVFDNRGVGNSGTPRGPYTTSGMAEDVIVLLDYIGWTEERGIYVVGLSMGGMIALELATRIPERMTSLVLGVTTAGGRPWMNLPTWKGATSLARIMTLREPEQIIQTVLEMVYPVSWLDQQAADGRTNREAQTEIYRRRHAATRPQQLMGHISQMGAALTHHVTQDRLARIAKSVPKVVILTGDDDYLVNPSNSKWLAAHMPEAQYVQWEKTGHALHGQWPERFNQLLEDAFREGQQRVRDGWVPAV